MNETQRAELQSAFRDAGDAIARANALIDEISRTGDVPGINVDIFAEYPQELPSLDELEFALRGVAISNAPEIDWDALPDLDTVERFGFDGSLRGLDGRPAGVLITWEDVARRAIAKLGEVERVLERD